MMKSYSEEHLRLDLDRIREASLSAVDPVVAVQRAMRLEGHWLHYGKSSLDLSQIERVYLIGVGKAAAKMTWTTENILGSWLSGGIVVTKHDHLKGVKLPNYIRVVEAAHPVPNEAGLIGAQAVRKLVSEAGQKDLIILLLSGGASALIPCPVQPLTLQDLQQTTALLLQCGATIQEVNAVRKHVDLLKGGQLARLANPAKLISFILSDVVGDRLDVIGSGPTVADETTFSDVMNILKKYDLVEKMPRPVMDYINSGMSGLVRETPKPGDRELDLVHNLLVGSNRMAAVEARKTAELFGYHTLLLSTFLEGEAREVGKMVAAFAKGIRFNSDPIAPPACVVMGGETTVTVNGPGKGGRNQELALSSAIALAGLPGVAVMSLATDGTDGPTDSAGAVVDGYSLDRMQKQGSNPQQSLKKNDSYSALMVSGDLLKIGPTGTNVNDLIVLLVQ